MLCNEISSLCCSNDIKKIPWNTAACQQAIVRIFNALFVCPICHRLTAAAKEIDVDGSAVHQCQSLLI